MPSILSDPRAHAHGVERRNSHVPAFAGAVAGEQGF
jgi:hypothetical protein